MDLLVTILLGLGSVTLAVLGNIIANELYDGARAFGHRLIRTAVARLPQRDRARWEEEWLSHFEECSGKLSQLLHAYGCYRASFRLQSEQTARRGQRSRELASFYALSERLIAGGRRDLWFRAMKPLARAAAARQKPRVGETTDDHAERLLTRFEHRIKRFSAIKQLLDHNKISRLPPN